MRPVAGASTSGVSSQKPGSAGLPRVATVSPRSAPPPGAARGRGCALFGRRGVELLGRPGRRRRAGAIAAGATVAVGAGAGARTAGAP